MKVLNVHNIPEISEDDVNLIKSIVAAYVGDTSEERYDEALIDDYGYLLPRGWQVNIRIQPPGSKEAFTVTLQADNGGGSFADVKMETLLDRHANEVAATGTDSLEVVQQIASSCIAKRIPVPGKDNNTRATLAPGLSIITMSDPKASTLQRYQHDWLKEQAGYTNFFGAIQTTLSSLDDDCHESGWILVAFSGATETQDLALAIMLAEEIATNLGMEANAHDLANCHPQLRFTLHLMNGSDPYKTC